MTPDRLREILLVVMWSQTGLARLLDMDEAQVRRWARGTAKVPVAVATWLERVAELHARNPPPER